MMVHLSASESCKLLLPGAPPRDEMSLAYRAASKSKVLNTSVIDASLYVLARIRLRNGRASVVLYKENSRRNKRKLS